MSYIGKEIEVIGNDGTIVKKIIVKSEKEINGTLVVTDSEGNIYSEEQLNLSYVLTPEIIMFEALKEANIIDKEYDYFDNFPYDLMHKVVETFMEQMAQSGYIAKTEEE